MKVRAGSLYTYMPVPLDLCHVCSTAKAGETVRVVNKPGCPRANTMGHAHIESEDGHRFLGLVHTNSLRRD